MRLPYRISGVSQLLYKAGIVYYKTVVIFESKVPMYDYYICDSLTENQLDIVRDYCEDVQVKTMGSLYVPEKKAPALAFPKTAWYRKQRRQVNGV